MTEITPQSREEALLQNILGAQHELGIPQSRIEKIWQYALGIDGIVLDPPQSRVEVLAIQVAELVRNGGGTQPTGSLTITKNDTYNVAQYANADVGVYGTEDGLIERTMTGVYCNSRIVSIKQYCFNQQSKITKASFPSCDVVGANAFYGCTLLEYVELPLVTSLKNNNFRGCSALKLVNLYSPTRSSIPSLENTTAFQGTAIANGNGYIVINDDLVDTLKGATNWSTYTAQIVSYSYAVEHDLIEEIEYTEPDVVYHTDEDALLKGTLTGSYTNDRVTELKQYGMTSLLNLTGVSFPEVTDLIPNYFFSGCTNLQSVNFPKAARIGDHTFRNCSSLIGVSFPKITFISTYAFQNCNSLQWLSFDEITEVPTLANTNAFNGCSSLVAFYFPDTLVDTAKTTSNWSDYASIIKPLSEKPTV